MKKFFALTALMVLLTSSSAFAVITGSSHDFSASGWTTEICAPCHTPHNAVVGGAGPLWSHSTAAGPWTMYSNPATALMVAATGGAAPVGVSLACLSCHDGVTNMDDFIGSGSTGTTMVAVGPTLGTDLSNDHPISFTYDDTITSGYETLATVQATALVFYGAGSNQLECATCHDVHNSTAFTSMLRITPAGSAICLTCHLK